MVFNASCFNFSRKKKCSGKVCTLDGHEATNFDCEYIFPIYEPFARIEIIFYKMKRIYLVFVCGSGRRLIGDFYFAAICVRSNLLMKGLHCCRHPSMMIGRQTTVGPSLVEEHFHGKHSRYFLCQ